MEEEQEITERVKNLVEKIDLLSERARAAVWGTVQFWEVMPELWNPKTTTERLYELMTIWGNHRLYELYFFTSCRIVEQSGTLNEEKWKTIMESMENPNKT